MKIVQVDVNRYEDVEAAVKETKVVINVVGPYWIWGTNVVRCAHSIICVLANVWSLAMKSLCGAWEALCGPLGRAPFHEEDH